MKVIICINIEFLKKISGHDITTQVHLPILKGECELNANITYYYEGERYEVVWGCCAPT